jgi:hypothetical protein
MITLKSACSGSLRFPDISLLICNKWKQHMFKPKTPISERPDYSSGGWIRTTNDLRVMSKIPESVPFVRRVMQISQTDEPWFLLARHAAIPQGDDLADRCAFSSLFTRVRQVLFLVFSGFLKLFFRIENTQSMNSFMYTPR